MKICMITRTYPPRIGGPGSVVQKVSYGLVENGFDVSVICSRVKGAPRFEVDRGVTVYRTRNVSDVNEFTFLNLGVSVSSIVKKILECRGHDIFHAHDISVAGFGGCIARKLVDKKFFLKYGGDLVLEYLSLKKFRGWDPKKGLEGTLEYQTGVAAVLHRVQSWYFNTYDMVLPDSFYGEKFLERRGVPSEKLKVLVNGIDVDDYHPILKREKDVLKESLGLPDRVIFTAMRLVGWKGVDVLIRAMDVVCSSVDVKLFIAGSGPERGCFEALVEELGLGDRVSFLGNVSRDDMPKYLSSCDVFVLPSYFDTTPNVLLEAMASGCTCVVSDIEGMREVVEGGCGVLVKVGDADDLAEKLIDVLMNPGLSRKLSKDARRRVVERYSWKKVVANYKELYSSHLDA